MKKHTFPIIIIERDEDGFYVATNPSLDGCFSQGKTMEEALENIQEATEMCLEDAGESAQPASSISIHLITA